MNRLAVSTVAGLAISNIDKYDKIARNRIISRIILRNKHTQETSSISNQVDSIDNDLSDILISANDAEHEINKSLPKERLMVASDIKKKKLNIFG